MKLSRLKSVAYNALRTSSGDENGYFHDPFEHYTPEFEIRIDLISGKMIPNMQGDDVERYYIRISKWFHEVLPKEGIPIEIIDEALIILSPKEKRCIIKAQGKKFTAYIAYNK